MPHRSFYCGHMIGTVHMHMQLQVMECSIKYSQTNRSDTLTISVCRWLCGMTNSLKEHYNHKQTDMTSLKEGSVMQRCLSVGPMALNSSSAS